MWDVLNREIEDGQKRWPRRTEKKRLSCKERGCFQSGGIIRKKLFLFRKDVDALEETHFRT